MAGVFKQLRDGEPPDNNKRLRMSVDTTESRCQYKRLEAARFPARIEALPHVLKLIDTMLMPPNEAVIDAAETGQIKWLKQLLREFKCDKTNARALKAAAARGQKEAVKMLLCVLKKENGLRFQSVGWRGLLKALSVAAEKGHTETFKLLIHETDPVNSTFVAIVERERIESALDEAARNGHLNVVKLVVEHAKEKRYVHQLGTPHSKALACPIAARQMEMTEVLFNLETLNWDLIAAFVTAVDTKQMEYAKRIFKLYVKQYSAKNLFISLARDGHLEAMKHLFPSAQARTDLMNAAFMSAARHGQTDVVAFLFEAASIATETLDTAIEDAAEKNHAETVVFLYSMQRISPRSIDKAFEATDSAVVIEHLMKNERIRDNSIIAAFKRASVIGTPTAKFPPLS